MSIDNLNEWDFYDKVAVPDGYDSKSIPEATSRNMEVLMNKINELVDTVNELETTIQNIKQLNTIKYKIMSISTSVVGFISADNETYKKHLKVLNACIEAKIKELPNETADYFNHAYPYKGLAEEKLEVELETHEWNDNESSSGFELIVADIPEGVHKIRFSNSF